MKLKFFRETLFLKSELGRALASTKGTRCLEAPGGGILGAAGALRVPDVHTTDKQGLLVLVLVQAPCGNEPEHFLHQPALINPL